MSFTLNQKDLSTVITQAERLATTIVSSTILAPAGHRGLGGFQFDIVDRETIDYGNNITTLPIQSGSFLNHHITRNPTIITVEATQIIVSRHFDRRNIMGAMTPLVWDKLSKFGAMAVDGVAERITKGKFEFNANTASNAIAQGTTLIVDAVEKLLPNQSSVDKAMKLARTLAEQNIVFNYFGYAGFWRYVAIKNIRVVTSARLRDTAVFQIVMSEMMLDADAGAFGKLEKLARAALQAANMVRRGRL